MGVFGLTGVIGSGKSKAAEYFRECGAAIIDADILAREVVAPNTAGLAEVTATFGSSVLQADGSLDRKTLGALIFEDTGKREALESIVHPRIRALFKEKLAAILAKNPEQMVIAVIPLLFESNNSYVELEKVICVRSTDEVCLKRIMERDGCNRSLAEQKLASQLPQSEKAKLSDIVIDNTESLANLQQQVQNVYDDLLKL